MKLSPEFTFEILSISSTSCVDYLSSPPRGFRGKLHTLESMRFHRTLMDTCGCFTLPLFRCTVDGARTLPPSFYQFQLLISDKFWRMEMHLYVLVFLFKSGCRVTRICASAGPT